MTAGHGFTGPCPHGRMAIDHCEDCALIMAAERGAPLGTPVPLTVPVPAAVAPDDVEIDLGDGRSVFVAAGDPIPADCVDLPRTERHGGSGRHREAGV